MTTHVPPPVGEISAISHFAAVAGEPQPGRQLDLIREAAPGFRAWFRGRDAGLGRHLRPGHAALSDSIRSVSSGDQPRTLSVADAPARGGALARARREAQGTALRADRRGTRPADSVFREAQRVDTRRIRACVRATAWRRDGSSAQRRHRCQGHRLDHVRPSAHPGWRRWVGTTEPVNDISPAAPIGTRAAECTPDRATGRARITRVAAPLQVPWYQASTFTALRPDALFPIDGDVLIGPGVALLSTPGHTIGNHTLVVNTESGIWASSENVIAAECLTPSTAVFPACAGTRAPGSRRLS